MVTPSSPAEVSEALSANGYLPDEGLATSIFLAISLERPLLLEGEAGVGKTEVAKVLARWTGGELLRLQCYEGIDASQAVYDWDYSRQLLHLRAAEATGEATGKATDELEHELYNERFLLKRALLQAIDHHGDTPPVLLIDEIDRADDEFEAYLLEVLSDYQITVPELGRFTATRSPIVVLTSNRTRDVHDALKRRCLYHWVEHPGFAREVAIVRLRVPHVIEPLARQVAAAVESLRSLNLYKPPGVAETIDWAQALAALGVSTIDERSVDATLGTVLKYREDQERARQHGLADLVAQATARAVAASSAPERIAVGFARVLRGAGLDVPIGAVINYVEALGRVGIDQRDTTYWAGRATLVRNPEDIQVYDRAFAVFWERRSADVIWIEPEVQRITLAIDDEDGTEAEDDSDEASTDPQLVLRFSAAEVLRHKDFAAYDDDELRLAQQLMTRLRLVGPPRISARMSPARRGSRPDLRRTMRHALRAGGEPIRRAWREPGDRLRRLVLLLDISGSMEPYARAMLRFVQAAVGGRQRVEAFALGTRLTRLTRELGGRDPDSALRRCGRPGRGLERRHPAR